MVGEYYKTKESVQEYIKLAKDVNGADLIEDLKVFLPANSVLLEIGSGPGTDWKILSKSFYVVGSDNSIAFLNHLTSSNKNGEFLELDAVSLKTNKNFDGIYSNKVLHHLNDNELEKSIKKQYEILNPNGIICHSFWKGEGSEIFKGLFVNYHTKNSLKKAFQKYFDILILKMYKEFAENDSFLLIARKK